MGGVISYGGRATFSIVWDNGTTSKGTPECIIRGVQWRIFDEIATQDDINAALSHAEQTEARAEAKKLADAQRRDEERKQHAANNSHLIKVSDKKEWCRERIAAENIRRELKRVFPSIKFSVTSEASSVNIKWTDGPTDNQVAQITKRHQMGNFNGMTDSYDYDDDRTFSDVFGGVRYVSNHREFTPEGVRTAWAADGNDANTIGDNWSYDGSDDYRRIMDVYRDTDLIGKVTYQPKAPKATGPFWSKRGLLAINENGYTREFRKVETAQKELDKLTAKGIKAEIMHGIHRGAIYIRRIDA